MERRSLNLSGLQHVGIFATIAIMCVVEPHLAQAAQGDLLNTVQNQVITATQGWQSTVMHAARSLFWILASIEIGIAAVWLAIGAASLDV